MVGGVGEGVLVDSGPLVAPTVAGGGGLWMAEAGGGGRDGIFAPPVLRG